MHHPLRIGLLAGAVLFAANAAAAAPTAAKDWALAGVILAAALVQDEITRRMRPGGRESAPHIGAAMASVWSLAAAVTVHLMLAIALVLALYAYRHLRGQQDLLGEAGAIACSVTAAHFVASAGAWATPSPQANTAGVLAIAAAGAAHLVATHAAAAIAGLLNGEPGSLLGRATDIGLEAALLTVGGITGALATGGPLVVFAAVPVVVTLYGAAVTQQLEDEASIDQKTGLATAASWQAHADRAFATAAPDRRPIGVLMVDLDYFKRLNDTYGHPAGDDVLAAVGACLRSQLRQSDLGGRFGGEEFTVLLPDTDIIDTMTTAERIRTEISSLRVPTVDNHGRHTVITDVTASIGAATYPHHGTTLQDCLRVADDHVYQAKQQGRNTVVGTR
ncbi:GGDEF domain-containing protein [Actinophytocola sp.]|uniref:sensor domain-containing diguanylate cyclase n=1 Tax=Actinophytocola sp. TaxID=1872138 RepID=UPI002ED405CF